MDTSNSGLARPPPSAPRAARTLPAHKERQANPKVKLLDTPMTGVMSEKANPTKQRIAQGVYASSSASKPSSLPPGLTIPKKPSALSKLSFKKKTTSMVYHTLRLNEYMTLSPALVMLRC